MKILSAPKETLDLTGLLNDGKGKHHYCVCQLDEKDSENTDIYFRPLNSVLKYNYPIVELKLNEFFVSLPLDWMILSKSLQDCEFLTLDELIGLKAETVLFNPFFDIFCEHASIVVNNIYLTNYQWITPKLQRNEFLFVPLTTKEQYYRRKYDDGSVTEYPVCCCVASPESKIHHEFSMDEVWGN